tara:strand:- start:20 stop:1048 length:1029 start_codon:yes stop_codon:yes gene_type:complete
MNANLQANIAPPKVQVVEATDLKERAEKVAERLLSDEMPDYDKNLFIQTLEELCEYSDIMKDIRDLPKVSIFGGARLKEDDADYQIAKEMGEIMAGAGYKVITGGGPGIMQAGHEGAGRKDSVGFNIILPFEQSSNHVIDGNKHVIDCKYFFTRKLMFLRESDAVVACAGGYGTMDELFETITLLQTGKARPVPLVLLEKEGGNFWDCVMDMSEKLIERGTINRDDLYLFRRFHSAQDAADYINNFYRRYHSVRYVDDKLVIRLKSPLPDSLYSQICEEFADFIGEWGLAPSDALQAENDEQDIINLPRLVMKANKKQPVELYKLIRALNRDVKETSTNPQD